MSLIPVSATLLFLEVDFAAAAITVTDIRKSVVEFTTVYQETDLTALVKKNSGFRNLQDLLKSNFTYGTIRDGSTSKALMGSRDSDMSRLWSRIVSGNGLVQDTAAGKRKVMQGDYAFILEKTIGDYLEAQDCGMETVGQFLHQTGYAFPAQKSDRNLPDFNRVLGELKRDGKISSLEDKWWAQQPCSGNAPMVSVGLLLALTIARLFL